ACWQAGTGGGCRGGRVSALVPPLAGGRLPRTDRSGRGRCRRVKVSPRRIRAIFRKELREYRHNGNIVYAMAILPLVFLIQPVIQVFTLSSRASVALRSEHSLLYMLAIPVLVPAALAAYSVV